MNQGEHGLALTQTHVQVPVHQPITDQKQIWLHMSVDPPLYTHADRNTDESRANSNKQYDS